MHVCAHGTLQQTGYIPTHLADSPQTCQGSSGDCIDKNLIDRLINTFYELKYRSTHLLSSLEVTNVSAAGLPCLQSLKPAQKQYKI